MHNIIATLERTIEQYRCRVANEHRLQRRNPRKLAKNKPLWDLPMMASTCCFRYQGGNFSAFYSDYSQGVKANSYDATPELRDRLLECAVINDIRIGADTRLPGCRNQVGRCAEPHAARKCIRDLATPRHPIPIDGLIFSIAHEVKTGEPRNPCAICHHVFPNIRMFPQFR